jgi:uncharacterized protein (DUF2164 family)
MKNITLSKQQKESLINKLQQYFEDELDKEIGQFEAEFFADFLLKEMGPAIYNQALLDAQSLLTNKIDDAFSEIERIDSL